MKSEFLMADQVNLQRMESFLRESLSVIQAARLAGGHVDSEDFRLYRHRVCVLNKMLDSMVCEHEDGDCSCNRVSMFEVSCPASRTKKTEIFLVCEDHFEIALKEDWWCSQTPGAIHVHTVERIESDALRPPLLKYLGEYPLHRGTRPGVHEFLLNEIVQQQEP